MARQKTSPAPAPEAPAPAGYTVLARRYRPQAFEQLVGQEHVARALENAIKSNRVAHAYLFTGARGVGKTSTARILAKCLNCETGPTTTPCDRCDSCRGISDGEDVDVIEIDGASNRSIDSIRDVRSNVQYRPSRSRFKIYIIDEVHMLTKEAFNALLKTLEEPPPHVKFIFATTEANKIPVTILSRCQRFDFAGIGVAPIVERLRDIVTHEGMQADEEALEMVARRAAGSMRDAQSLLDQLLAFGGDRLSADQVHSLLGTAGDDRVAELAGAVLAKDPRRAVEILAELASKTLQPGELLDQLMAYWRDLMVSNVAGEEAKDLSVPTRHRPALVEQARSLSLETILAGLDLLNNARFRLKTTAHGRLVVETALVRLCRLEDLGAVSQLTQLLSQGIPPGAGAARSIAPPEGLKKKLIAPPPNGEHKSITPLRVENLAEVWPALLQTLPPLLVNNLEKAGLPAITGPNTLVLRFPAAYNSDREFCQEPTRLRRVESALQEATGQEWKVRIEASLQAAPAGRESAGESPAEAESSLARNRRLREEAENDPLVRKAIEVLGAQVVRVEDGFNSTAAAASTSPATDEEEEGEEG